MIKTRVLVADDEPEARLRVAGLLRDAGYAVTSVKDGIEALSQISKEPVDLITLDVMMPGIDGFEVCCRIREWSQIPIIMLSAVDDEDLKANVIHFGADDYVVKPFGAKELLARMEAVLRRVRKLGTVVDKPAFVSGEVEVDFRDRRVKVKEKEIDLTAIEFGVLQEFVLNQGQLLTHRVLLHRVWGAEYGEEKEYVRVIVNRLRKKLGDDPVNPRYIKTLPGIGYRFLTGETPGSQEVPGSCHSYDWPEPRKNGILSRWEDCPLAVVGV